MHACSVNMYVETHIQRVSEDPEAFVAMMKVPLLALPLLFHCLPLTFHCLSLLFHCSSTALPLPSLDLSLPFKVAREQWGSEFECNGDLSHYFYRAYDNQKGHMPEIMVCRSSPFALLALLGPPALPSPPLSWSCSCPPEQVLPLAGPCEPHAPAHVKATRGPLGKRAGPSRGLGSERAYLAGV